MYEVTPTALRTTLSCEAAPPAESEGYAMAGGCGGGGTVPGRGGGGGGGAFGSWKLPTEMFTAEGWREVSAEA